MSTRKKTSAIRRKADVALKTAMQNSLGIAESLTPEPTAAPPTRSHTASYHWPLLLHDKYKCDALLSWFQGIHDDREMPWRKPFINPVDFNGRDEELGKVLAKRAYEVWVSEIMLQQTRVSTVIPYFKNWIGKWPTVQDLAKADHDEVLAAWKGLGYYSRATRLHQGAQDVISKSEGRQCPIPSTARELLEISGIGPYTAGAISSIAFGEAEPVLDGNVARVLSRQIGLYADVKDKKTSDFLWKVADRLVKNTAKYPDTKHSDIPGQWNQALMELGSTICTPRPKCGSCPIQKTCRAFSEGEMMLAERSKLSPALLDIEDACSYCEQLDTEEMFNAPEEEEEEDNEPKVSKKRKQDTKPLNTISQYFTATASKKTESSKPENLQTVNTPPSNGAKKRKALHASSVPKYVITYCSLFPKKIAKKKVAEEACAVCVIELRNKDKSKWLIEQRPAKGLLASLWQFPQCTLHPIDPTPSSRKAKARDFVSDLKLGPIPTDKAKHVAEIDTLMHVFSHLKLTMHIHQFKIEYSGEASPSSGGPRQKWVETEAMEDQTLSTGMRRCWELVKKTSVL
jgi:A/G-specific adenine glycosylase